MGQTAVSSVSATGRWIRDIASPPARYHSPRRPGLPAAWWRSNRRYTLYMLRELSSVTNALWSLRLLAQLRSLRRGPEAYGAFVKTQQRPKWLVFNLLVLGLAAIHSVTFLRAAGKGPTVHVGGHLVPERAIIGGAFAGWAAASQAVLLVLLARWQGRGAPEEVRRDVSA